MQKSRIRKLKKLVGEDNLYISTRFTFTPVRIWTTVNQQNGGNKIIVSQTWYEYIKTKWGNYRRLSKYKNRGGMV